MGPTATEDAVTPAYSPALMPKPPNPGMLVTSMESYVFPVALTVPRFSLNPAFDAAAT